MIKKVIYIMLALLFLYGATVSAMYGMVNMMVPKITYIQYAYPLLSLMLLSIAIYLIYKAFNK